MIRGLGDGERAALLISECQNQMTNSALVGDEGLPGEVERRGTIIAIASLADRCREVGVPVFHCTIVHRKDWAGMAVNCSVLGRVRKRGVLRDGHAEAEIHPRLTPAPSDIVVNRRHGLTAFHGTDLDPLMRNLGIQTVILTGVSTNLALAGVSIEAVNRGYHVVLPEDCTAGASAETHEFMVQQFFPLVATITDSAAVTAALSPSN